MKLIYIDKDGNVVKPSLSDRFKSLTNRIGYAILALFALSYFLYMISPFIWKDITLFQALLLGCLISVLKEYYYSSSGLTFLVASIGYMLISLGAYFVIH